MNSVPSSTIRNDSVVCFLIVNKIETVPEISIMSALKNSDAEIIIGYINESDIPATLKSNRIKFIKIETPKRIEETLLSSNQNYIDFSQDQFFQIVQLKWILINELLKLNYRYIVYSDIDVVWINNPLPSLELFFEDNPSVNIQIQSLTVTPNKIHLCMGFVAFRNCQEVKGFISTCKQLHFEMLVSNPKTGDDDVVTKLYLNKDFSCFIRELPQSTFPVGSMLNLYSKRNLFPGLSSSEPYIFHANYVVGMKEKLKVLQTLSKTKFEKKVQVPSSFLSSMNITLRNIKYRILELFK